MSFQFNLSWSLPVTTPDSEFIYNYSKSSLASNSSDSWQFKESPMFHFLINVLATIQTAAPPNTTSPSYSNFTQPSFGTNQVAIPSPVVGIARAPIPRIPPGALANETTASGYSSFEVSLIVIAGSILSLLTFGMNFMVMVSFKVDKQLQTISNYFLFSLAVADFTIGLISIPLMTLYTAVGEWTLGYEVCQFWLCVDYLMSNASVYNLLLISFDRYFSVTRPLTYRPRRTMKKAMVMIASTYIISLILWPPWIISWPYIEGKFIVSKNECMVQFLLTNPYVTIGTIIAAFYLPVTIMIVLYARVFYETKKRQREFGKLQALNQRSQYRTTKATTVASSRNSPSRSQPGRRISNKMQNHNGGGMVIQNDASVNHPLLVHRQSSKLQFQDRITEIKNSGSGQDDSFKSWISRFFYSRRRHPSLHSSTFGDMGEEESFSSESRDSLGNLVRRSSIQDSGVGPESGSLTCSLRSRGSRKRNHIIDPGEALPMLHSNLKEDVNSGSAIVSRKTISNASNTVDGIPTNDTSTYTVLIKLEDSDGHQRKLSENSTDILCSGGPLVTVFENSQAETKLAASTNQLCSTSLAPPDTSGRKGSLVRQRSASDAVQVNDTELLGLRKQFQENFRETSPNLYRNRPGSSRVYSPNSKRKNAANQQFSPNNFISALNNAGSQQKRKPTVKHQKQKKHHKHKKSRQEKKQESKAAKTLSAILLAFILTWTPYSIIIVIEAFKPGTVPVALWNLSYYLCYINSTVNPLCYALCNATFRGSYIRILTCKWRSPRSAAAHTSRAMPSGFATR